MCTKEAQELVMLAADGLVDSAHDGESDRRYGDANLAALRAAAAVVAERGGSPSGAPLPRNRVANVWQVVMAVAPELAEWAALFEMNSRRRVAAATGGAEISTREADDCLRDAAAFVARVAQLLGLPNRSVDVSAQWLVVR